MSKVLVNESSLSSIGNAIREKNGETTLYKPSEMGEAILAITTGGGGEVEPIVLTGDCRYRFAYNGWNWFIEKYGKQISISNITLLDHIFYNCTELIEIPFEINQSNTTVIDFSNGFYNCEKLEVLPMINNLTPSASEQLFYNCNNLRNFPDGFGETWNYNYINSSTSRINYLYYNCYSLRKIPTVLLNNFWSKATSNSSAYYRTFTNCYALDEINGLGVNSATLTSNTFNQTFNSCGRLNNMTFAVNEDGTPKTANWKTQTINLSAVGNGLNINFIEMFKHNSGITADKKVTDDATYQALKNDPDWYTEDVNYSRYNHDSAVNTINSLPDTSAYLASSGGTNTITFNGASGALTDGGAINTLTETEIAVATAKGWTVSFS